jgi:DNA-binding FrmR family transcriptional regulator
MRALDAAPKHRSHPEIVKRLRRADGHLRSVIAMIEAERPCLEIARRSSLRSSRRQGQS